MKATRFTPPYHDDAIVTWLDGEMEGEDARQFEQSLQHDEQLAGRTEELRKSHQDYQRAFASLLDEAPLARMQERLEAHLAANPSPQARVSRRALIAASLSFLVLGTGVGYLVRTSSGEGDESAQIRDLEAQYMSLYSTETLVDADSAAPVLKRGLARTAQDLGLQLDEQQLMLPGAELKMVRILRYESTSIAQIAWLHHDYGPMALCISATEMGDTTPVKQEKRHSMNLAWWNHRGHQYVLIGRNPASELQATAQALLRAIG
ncbi:anti-sigma factor family protein [Enterobacter soli]